MVVVVVVRGRWWRCRVVSIAVNLEQVLYSDKL
jgi:hypothetical protein